MIVELVSVGTELLLYGNIVNTNAAFFWLRNVRCWDCPCTIKQWSGTMRSVWHRLWKRPYSGQMW